MKLRKIAAAVLSLSLVFGAVPFSNVYMNDSAVYAEEEYTEGTYDALTYMNYGDYIEITDCDDSATEVEIPSEIDGVPVSTIGNYAFLRSDSLSNVIIPDGITSIGACAFGDCDALTSITISDSVNSIGESAFGDCDGLTSITVPDSVASIGEGAFSLCEVLMSITILNPDCEIGDGFYSPYTISNGWNDNNEAYYTGKIYGYENSTAEAFALKYGYSFEAISENTLGDIDGDSTVTVADAIKIMAYCTNAELSPLSDSELDAADIYQRGDGVGINDAVSIQKYLTKLISELPESYMD